MGVVRYPPTLFVLLRLGLGIYKCKQMGLVPMGTGDWLQFETRGEVSFDGLFLLGGCQERAADGLGMVGSGMVCCAIRWDGTVKNENVEAESGRGTSERDFGAVRLDRQMDCIAAVVFWTNGGRSHDCLTRLEFSAPDSDCQTTCVDDSAPLWNPQTVRQSKHTLLSSKEGGMSCYGRLQWGSQVEDHEQESGHLMRKQEQRYPSPFVAKL